MLPKSSALTHAGRRGLEHDRRAAVEAVTQFDTVGCVSLRRANCGSTITTLLWLENGKLQNVD